MPLPVAEGPAGKDPGWPPVPGEPETGLNGMALVGDIGAGPDTEIIDGPEPGADEETTPGVKPDTTPEVDAPLGVSLGAAADPAPEGDTVGSRPGEEPEPGTLPVPETEPVAGADISEGLPTETVPGP